LYHRNDNNDIMKFSDFYIEKQYFSDKKKKQDKIFISTTGTRHYIKKTFICSQ